MSDTDAIEPGQHGDTATHDTARHDTAPHDTAPHDTAPGDSRAEDLDVVAGVRSYLVGLALAAGLTVASFLTLGTSLVWAPVIPILLVVLAIGQMGIHLAFFLHITTSPDSANNVLALAFGLLIVLLLLGGSLWIMSHLNANMLPMDRIMQMQR